MRQEIIEKTKRLLATTIFVYSVAGFFGGLFLIFGCDFKLHGECATYPFDGTLGVQFGLAVTLFSLIFGILSYGYLCVYHSSD